MESNIIYTDVCCPEMEAKIKEELNLDIVFRFGSKDWSVYEAMSLITTPNLCLAVINEINEISVMEIALLSFMCKPVLVTAKSIDSYPAIEKSVNYVDKNATLKDKDSNFVSWYRTIMEEQWTSEDCPQMQAELCSGSPVQA